VEQLYVSIVTLAEMRFGIERVADLIIAATALHHDQTVVTRDTADYAKARVELVNPWE
jgi:predicted nucleic acid-binding protein